MFEATVNEFPFVEQLPKRQKSKLAQVWELIGMMSEYSQTEGALLPVMLVAKSLNVSRTRVDEIVANGYLKRISIDGHVFITENSLVEYAKTERKNGRPLKLATTFKECLEAAKRSV